MLMAALTYITGVLRLVIALGLGPLFIFLSLFGQTKSIFKNWLSFIASRSLEIMVLFLVIYLFLVLIDERFTSLLWYRVCTKNIGIGFINFFNMPFAAGTDRGLTDWFSLMIAVGALIFLLHTVIQKIPGLVNDLVKVAGAGASKSGINTTDLASGMMKELYNGAKHIAMETAPTAFRYANETRKEIARFTGLSEKWDNLTQRLPRSPLSIGRDMKIDTVMRKARQEGMAKNLSGAELDKYIREQTSVNLVREAVKDKNQFSLLGIDSESVANRLNQKLVKEPLKDFIKEEAKKLRANKNLFGKKLRDQLKENAEKWAAQNLYVGKDGIQKYLNNMKDLLQEESQMSSMGAARRLVGDSKSQNEYLDYLNRMEAQRKQRSAEAKGFAAMGDGLSRFGSWARDNTIGAIKSKFNMRDNLSASRAKKAFLEDLAKQERKKKYKDDEMKALKGQDKGLFKKASGWDTKKSFGQRFQRTDGIKLFSNGKIIDTGLRKTRLSAEEAKEKRRLQRIQDNQSLKTNIAKEVASIASQYKESLKKYGYTDESASLIQGAPSKAQLQREAKSQLDALAGRMTIVEDKGGEMSAALQNQIENNRSLLEKLSKEMKSNREKLEKAKQDMQHEKKQLEEINKKIKESKGENKEHQEKRSLINQNIQKLDSQSKTFEGQIKELTSQEKDLDMKNRGLETEVGKDLSLDLAAFEEQQKAMVDYINAAKDKIDQGKESEIDNVVQNIEEGDALADSGDDPVLGYSGDLEIDDEKGKQDSAQEAKEEKAKVITSRQARNAIQQKIAKVTAQINALEAEQGVDNSAAINVLKGQLTGLQSQLKTANESKGN